MNRVKSILTGYEAPAVATKEPKEPAAAAGAGARPCDTAVDREVPAARKFYGGS